MAMGHPTDFDPNIFGPFGPMVQSCVTAFESMGLLQADANGAVPQRLSAPVKAAARCQLEVCGLANRRTQAYLQIPARLAQCRSPQDLMNEQMAFWRTAAEQYGETYRKIFDTWAGTDVWIYSNGRPGVAERDYITFNGAKDSAPQRSEPTVGKPQRRVA
ncbi:phasin family protein [Hyphomicrobium sp.]|uniref:phasin family protein n=1 Tax=Hyphomicrobium sp. TaxID=82 RepID=UPI002FE0F2ED